MTTQDKSSALPSSNAPTAPNGDMLTSFAEALSAVRGDAKPEGEKPEGEGTPDGEKSDGKPKKVQLSDLATLATQLGVEPAELYKVTVPSAIEGAEPFTIGKLKDLAKEHDDYMVRELELEEKHRKRQAEFTRAEAELQAILSTLPPDAIKPEARAKLQERHNAAMVKERQRVLEVIPEWKSAELRAQEFEQIAEHLKDYGFPDSYLSSVYDHRTLRYIRDNWRREMQIRKALEKVAERKPTTPPKSKQSAPKQPKTNGAALQPHGQSFGATIINAGKRN